MSIAPQTPPEVSPTANPVTLSQSDKIVGAAAYQFAKSSFIPLLEDSEFTGALYVLSDFTQAQLDAFALAAAAEASHTDKVLIRFTNAVGVRNAPRKGKVVITTDADPDVAASLGNKVTIKADQLKEAEEAADTWTKVASNIAGIALTDGTVKQVRAMIKGLFDCGSFSTGTAAQYIADVIGEYNAGTPLLKAAGLRLPKLELPLFEECFLSLGPEKSAHPSQWRKRFEEHQRQDCYLNKRQPNALLLDPDQLRNTLERLRDVNANPKLPDDTLNAFGAYIEAAGTRSPATEDLLFNHDWSHVRNCFDRQKKTTSTDFAAKTRNALTFSGINPSAEDEGVLVALESNPRKSGEAAQEFKDFFESYVKAISTFDLKLLLEWEDFVYGRRITCSDLFDGILECLQRTLRLREPGLDTWVVIEGANQNKPANFISPDSRYHKACEFFERHYGKLEKHTGKKIQFRRTLLPEYSTKVKPILAKTPKSKNKGRGRNRGFEFHITVFQRGNDTSEQRLATLPFTWLFPKDSVLALEGDDLDALVRYRSHSGKTALAEALGDYESVGRKGVPLDISLHSISGFASSPGASGRGSFIPAQTKICSLALEFEETISQAVSGGWLATPLIEELQGAFRAFNVCYGQSIAALASDALDASHVTPMVEAYRNLLDRSRQVPHESTRRKILHSILRIGSATIDRSGHRPKLAIICPWHPLRMEAATARNRQLLETIISLLSPQIPAFSDGAAGSLFFREMRELTSTPLQPELTLCWDGMDPQPLIVSQALGSYTLHEPVEREKRTRSCEDNAVESAKTIIAEIDEYLRLQPHERDNLSILLYNCDSPELPSKLVEYLNKRNRDAKDEKITCQVLLAHHDDNHLRHLYKNLVASADGDDAEHEDSNDGFLSKVRINITAASRLKHQGRAQPADIAYCRDLLSTEAKVQWDWIERRTVVPDQLRPHQWNRTRPFQAGDPKVRVLLCCPAQTETGWALLHSIAFLCATGADNAWSNGQCPVPMRTLNFDNKDVERIIRETHELAVWVINQDELLDRRLLEQKEVKVIRYIQSTTQGRNLIISSKARDTLLVSTLKERLAAILPAGTLPEIIPNLVQRLINDANAISGGLVLKAARRANNTSELFGMVLSRYLVQSELGLGRPAAWCFLDDYSHWLGKKEGANIADLLVLAPTYSADGKPHLDIILTEAKFVSGDVSGAKTTSEKQLADTLTQISQALTSEPKALDQQLWLARLSDMILSRTIGTSGAASFDPEKWRSFVRNRECTFSVWGYSHIFVHSPVDIQTQVSTCKGISTQQGTALQGLQEVFGPDLTRSLLLQLSGDKVDETTHLRAQNGHPGFNNKVIRDLSIALKKKSETVPKDPDNKNPDNDGNLPPGKTETTSLAPVPPAAIKTEETGIGQCAPQSPAIAWDQPKEALTRYLEYCAARATSSLAEGHQWLEKTTTDLKQALLCRGLSAKLAEGFAPILTPNAAIIKLHGSKDMTVPAVEAKAEEIYTSSGLRIISVTPEPGRVSIAVARPNRQILHTPQVFLALLRKQTEAQASPAHAERLFVGICEENGMPLFLDPFNQPHTLVAGITGSGKSVLIQNLILYIALSRSPDDAQLFLIDAKYGVDYIPLQLLPHVTAGSGGIIDDPDSAISSLEELVAEMENRYKLFKEAKVKDIQAYRRSGQKLATIWVIHDEFADWMQTEDYAARVPEIVNRLGAKARGAGIFLIFAAQRPDNTVMPMQLRSQLGNRLILKVDGTGTSEVAMGEKNAGAEKLLGKGHMLAKTGETPQPVFVQVPFLDMNDVPLIVQLLRLIYGLPLSEELPRP